VTLIDRRNHHVFQPLLYQVATASLSPATSARRSVRCCAARPTARWCWPRSRASISPAGACASAGGALPRDYRHIDTRTTRVILFEGGPRLLEPFPPALSARAQRDLERMGVEVRLNSTVTGVTPARPLRR
jgi:NADH dehydrogenase FAD-containing subunit